MYRIESSFIKWKTMICCWTAVTALAWMFSNVPSSASTHMVSQKDESAEVLLPKNGIDVSGAETPMTAHKAIASNPLLLRMQRNELTVSVLLDELGSRELLQRRYAAEAIAALRNHYLVQAQAVAERGYAGHVSSEAEWYALSTLGFLRPTQTAILSGAVDHISFVWTPGYMFGMRDGGYAAAYLLVRGSFPALPILARHIPASPSLPNSRVPRGDEMQLASTACILGPAAVPWLRNKESLAQNIVQREGWESAVRFVSAGPGAASSSDAFNFFGWLRSTDALGDRFYTGTLKDIDMATYKVKWDLAESLADNKIVTINTRTMSLCSYASDRIKTTLALLSYRISDRTSIDSTQRLPGSNPYPVEVQVDAVRVLGYLRYVDSYYPPWTLLRQLSHKEAIEDDSSDRVMASIRALGQIDMPAIQFLAGQISSEVGENQQRAATFALGKIAGRYAVFYIQDVIDDFQRGLAQDKDNQATDQTHIARLQAMLKLGQEKHWFEGDFYGVGDPHAYDLIFPDEAKPGNTQPPAPVATPAPQPAK